MIQVDISGLPPIPTSSKQSSRNLLFLAGFWFLNPWSHFKGLNEEFLGERGKHLLNLNLGELLALLEKLHYLAC